MTKITVGTVSWYSGELITELFQSLQHTAADKDLRFIVCDNTNGSDQNLYELLNDDTKILPHSPLIPYDRRRDRAAGSFAHASGLNMMLGHVQTDYCLFLDPDCILLAKGWDTLCKSLLDGRFVAVGAPYHATKIPKYHDFPSPIFVFFRTEVFQKIAVDWTPYLLPLSTHIKDQILRAVAISVSYLGEHVRGRAFYNSNTAKCMKILLANSSKDTGWRIPSRIAYYGYDSHVFTSALEKTQLDKSYAGNTTVTDLMNEFELYLWDGIPILTHYYGVGHRRKGNVEQTLNRWRYLAQSVAKCCT